MALCAVLVGLWAFWFAPRAEAQVTPDAIRAALKELQATVDKAKDAGHQTLYAEIPLILGPHFVDTEWDKLEDPEQRQDGAKFLMRNIKAEKAWLEGVLAGKKNLREVPPIPEYKKLTKKGNYFTLNNKPVLIVTNRNSGGEKGDRRFCGPGTLYWMVSAVGASRYDYRNTPIWPLYQKDPKSHRVYDGGWCGHIIKDKWSIGGQGGRKGICIISLDYPPMREAVRQAILMRARRRKKGARFKEAKILSMDWEFTYQNYDEPTKVKWQDWLRKRYKTIDRLNETWGVKLASFEAVTLPSVHWGREQNPGKFYDFGEFNMWRFTDYLLWARKVIEKECPGWPMTVGGGAPFGVHFAKTGIDEEYMRLRGVVDVFLSETGSRSWGTASVFDLQHSMDPTAMIHDPEYHSSGGFMTLMFLHGCSSLDFYNWSSRGVRKSLGDGYSMLRGCLDVRRLPEEIIQFPKAVPQAALFYSRGSLIQKHPGQKRTKGRRGAQTPYTLETEKCYRAGTTLDTAMGFVTTRQAKLGIRKDLKVLIVPGAYFVNPDAAAKIVTFAKSGGTVVVTPTSLVADEYNRRRFYLKAFGIEVTGETVPKYLSAKARAGVAQPKSEYSFIQGPIAPTVVTDEPTATLTWRNEKAKHAPGRTLAGRGIRQQIKVTGPSTALATYDDGSPAIVANKLGRGEVLYLAMQLDEPSMTAFLDWTYERADVERWVRATDPQDRRIPGLESRTVTYRGGYLTYVYNMTQTSVKVKLQPGFLVRRASDLSLAEAVDLNQPIDLGPWECRILKLTR